MNGEKQSGLLGWVVVLAAMAVLTIVSVLLTTGRTSGGVSGVRINEILASNSVYPDPDGQYRDFIELYNGGSRDADLAGCGLTDRDGAAKYVFPEGTTLPAGGYLAVWCDAGAAAEDGLAPFSVSKDGGETVSLLSAHGAVLGAVETIPTTRNCPMIPDGAGGWTTGGFATPGFENSAEGYGQYLAACAEAGNSRTVRISEVMCANSLYAAPDGEYYDWLELYNGGSTDADLSGYGLSDVASEIKYALPDGTILPAGEYLVVWCGAGGAGFSLRRDGGETLRLFDRSGNLIDRADLPALGENESWARGADGVWTVSDTPTPGYENAAAGYEAYISSLGISESAVVISEVMADNRGCVIDGFGEFSDWIELYNTGNTAENLSGFWLSDDPASPARWRIPALTLAPGEYALIFCDGRDAEIGGEYHTNFSLSKFGETVTLSNPAGILVSSLSFGELGDDRSAISDDGDAVEISDTPSPGYENSLAGVLAFRAARETPSPLAINEVMPTNITVLPQPYGNYYDWAELKNASDESVSLAGYALTDSLNKPERFLLPDVELAPGQTWVVLLCGEDEPHGNYACAGFALDAREDWLYLTGPDGAVVDFVHVYGLPYQGSIGRTPGENGFFCFTAPSPGQDNSGGLRGMAERPAADVAPGTYDGVDSLRVSLSGPGEIRYTTNGSVPTASSPLYDEPIELSATTILRARCFIDGLLPGETATLSYFINEGHTLPVVSLVGDPAAVNGIYQNYESNQEIMANLSFFEEGGSFSIDCGLTLHGASSRWAWPKKSYKAIFRPRYAGELEYDVFGDGEITSFHSLNLRGGTMVADALVRDEICSTVAKRVSDNVLPLNTRYCVLYINGRYWGIYAIREAFSEKYAADHLGVDEEDIRISRAPTGYTRNYDLNAQIRDLSVRGARDEARYDEIASWLDMDSLADWMILEGYFSNNDVAGNIRYIYNARDGRWRFGFFDFDHGLQSMYVTWDYVFDTKNEFGGITRNMVQNPIFRDQLLRRLAELVTTTLTPETVDAVIREYYEQLTPEMAREVSRWHEGANWENDVAILYAYSNADRGEKTIRTLAAYLGLSQEELDAYFGDILK